jgi:RimJ/RimL family protein N-acetyltransferase
MHSTNRAYFVLDEDSWPTTSRCALSLFLDVVPTRPLHGRVVKDNIASRRVLEHNGFTVYGEDRGFAEGRGAEVEEWLLVRHAL